MKNIIRIVPIISVMLLPLAVSAQSVTSVSDLIAQTQSLIQQINSLQTQQKGLSNASGGGSLAGGTMTAVPGVCPQLSRPLKLGLSGNDVSSLQQYLAQDRSIYPEQGVTGYYGALTQAAVQRWQARFSVVSSGTPDTTGYGVVGPRTALAIKTQCAPGLNLTGAPPVVSGFIQVTPASGAAPLNSTITATVNTTGSCTGTSYTLDFGDGASTQQVISTAGSCSQITKTFSHAYQSVGVYTVTLSAGSHKTTATITVSGSGTSTTGTTSGGTSGNASIVVNVNAGSVAQGATLPISWQSSNAPSSSSVALWLINVQSGTIYPLAATLSTTGTLNAMIPALASQGTVPPVGSYVVLGKIYTPSDAILTGTTPTYVALAQSGTFNITSSSASGTGVGSGTYSILSVTTGIGGNQSSVAMQISYPACAAYTVDWGDGSQAQSGSAATTGCSTQNTLLLNHTYVQNGTVLIRLSNGSGVQQATASLAIAGAGTNTGYGILSVTPNFSGGSLNVSAQLSVPQCPSYSLDWGDNTTPTSQSAQAGCTGGTNPTPTFVHTYGANGSFVIRLMNASSTLQSSASITLSSQ